MTHEKEITGLCVNCNNKTDCSYLQILKQPVLFCEEYYGTTIGLQVADAVSQVNSTCNKETTVNKKSNGIIGLCSNCENYEICAIPKPAGGTWHCEEYR